MLLETELVVPDALSRDIEEEILRERCKEIAQKTTEELHAVNEAPVIGELPSIEKLRVEQIKEFGELLPFVELEAREYLLDEKGLLCRMIKKASVL